MKRVKLLIFFVPGWIDVMRSVMWITGPDQQPQQDAAQFNALFFVFYNLVGAVFILTLFVSVIIENFTKQSGMALLTSEQRQVRFSVLRPSLKPCSDFIYALLVDRHQEANFATAALETP